MFNEESTLSDLLRLERSLHQKDFENRGHLRIRLLGNFSTQFLARSLRVSLRELGLSSSVEEGNYAQWEPELLMKPHSERLDWLILGLSSREFLAVAEVPTPLQFVERVEALLEEFTNTTGARAVVLLPEITLETVHLDAPRSEWLSEVRYQFQSTFSRSENLFLFDLNPIIAEIGLRNWTDNRDWVLSKLPFRSRYIPLVGSRIAQFLSSFYFSRIKVIAVDFDNTLWGGEVGEIGAEAVDLDVHGKGYGYLLIQNFLRHQKESGVVLVGLSKNEESVAKSVFDNRSEMLLSWEDFALVRANFLAKSSNLQSALTSLGLSSQGLFLIDDSGYEIEEVRRVFPHLHSVPFTQDPSDMVASLLGTNLFSVRRGSGLLENRTMLYREEATRAEEMSSAEDLSEFLKGLEMTLRTKPLALSTLPRVAELFQRTNQFNFSGLRPSEGQLKDWLHSENPQLRKVLAFELTDRVGPYGIISAAIINLSNPKNLRLENLVVSCRVFGRGVEEAIFASISRTLLGVAEGMEIDFRNLPKNLRALEFLRNHFVEKSERGGDLSFWWDFSNTPWLGFVNVEDSSFSLRDGLNIPS